MTKTKIKGILSKKSVIIGGCNMKTSEETITCSFTMDRKVYNAYKTIVFSKGKKVKEDLKDYMISVIKKEKDIQAEKLKNFDENNL